MTEPTFHSHGVWARLTSLARDARRASVAVPYFGSGASKLLPLKKGDTLVVKFDREAIGCGQVNPTEIIALLKRGVEVHNCTNVHAKVFVFDDVALVGSTNVSSSSANALIEACAEIKGQRFAAKCRTFVHSLTGDRVGIEYAKSMVQLYRPPRFSGGRRVTKNRPRRVLPGHSDLWLVALVTGTWKAIDHEHEEAGWSKAEQALTDPKTSQIETFSWSGSAFLEKVKRGQRVLQGIKEEDGKVFYSPPGRVLSIERYRVKGRKKAIVYLEVPKGKRRRAQKTFLESLGPAAKGLGNPRWTKRIRNLDVLYALGRVFR